MKNQGSASEGFHLTSSGWAFPAACLLLIVQPLVFYHRVLFNPRMKIPYDIAGYHMPLAAYLARCFRQGVFPFWDPYPYCGVPIHADFTAQLFYPLTWISLLLGNLSAGRNLYYWIEWLVPLHMILGGLFAFFLLRSLGLTVPTALFGGTVYQLGGFFASQAQHLGAICCGAWMPLVLLCVWKLSRTITIRWVCALALAIALTILSGFTATAMAVFGAAGLTAIGLALSRRPNWRLLIALAVGLALGHGIAAVQLIPTYQLTQQSVASTRAQIDGTGGGLRVQSLASLVIPNYYHIFTPFDPSRFKLPINFTFLYVYCGIIPFVLLLIAPFLRGAPHARMFFILTVLSVFWMLGDDTPVYRFVYPHLPRLVRGALYAEFALLAFSMFAALTCAVALQQVGRRAPQWLFWGVALFTAADLIRFGANKPMNSTEGSYKQWENEYQFYLGPANGLETIHRLTDTTNPPTRVDYLQKDVLSAVNGAELLKLPTPNGDNPFALKRIIALRWLYGTGYFWERQLPVIRPSSPILRMLNVGFLASTQANPELDHLPIAAEDAGVRWYRNPGAQPRFFLVPRVHIASGEKEAVSYLARADFKPAEEAVVEAPAAEAQGPREGEPLGGGEVHVEEYSANRVELRVTATARAFLATSETLYPGWTATINGRRAPLYMTNGAFRGLLLNQGTNHVIMTYWPEGFMAWVAISVLCALLAIAGLVFGGVGASVTEPC